MAFVMKDEGVYKGTILFHGLNCTPKDTLFIEFKVRLTHKENDEGEFSELETPFTRPLQLYLSEGAKTITVQNLKYLGYEGKSPAQLDPGHPEAHSFKGLEVYLSCQHTEYKDKPQEKWNLQRRRKAADPKQLQKIIGAADEWFADEMEQLLNPDAVPAVDAAF